MTRFLFDLIWVTVVLGSAILLTWKSLSWSIGARQLLWRSMRWASRILLALALLIFFIMQTHSLPLLWTGIGCVVTSVFLRVVARVGWHWHRQPEEHLVDFGSALSRRSMELAALVGTVSLSVIVSLLSQHGGVWAVALTPVAGIAMGISFRQLAHVPVDSDWPARILFGLVFAVVGIAVNLGVWSQLCIHHSMCP